MGEESSVQTTSSARHLPDPQAQLKLYEQYSRELLCQLAPDGIIQYVNPTVERLLGYRAQEMIGQPMLAFTHPDDQDSTEAHYAEAARTRRVTHGIRRIRTKQGRYCYVDAETHPVMNAHGQVTALVTVGHDVTGQQRAELDLRRSETRLKAILQDQTELVCRYLPDKTILFANKAYCRAFGCAPEDVAGQQFAPIIHPADQDQNITNLTRAQPSRTITQRNIINGETRWIDWTNRAFFDEQGTIIEYQAVGRDITEQVRAKQALQTSEARFRLLAEYTSDVIALHDVEGIYVYVSPSAETMLGYAPEDLIGKDPYEYFHPDDIERIRSESHAQVQQGQVVRSITYRMRRIDNRYIWLETHTRPVFKADGSLHRLVTTSREVTTRIIMEQALRQSETHFRGIYESAAVGIAIGQADGTLIQANPTLQQMLGYDPQPGTADAAKGDTSSHANNIQQSLFGSFFEANAQTYRVEKQFTHQNGRRFWGNLTVSMLPPVATETAAQVPQQAVAILQDITALKEAELDLARSNEDLEQFAYIVSHDLREPLRMITSYLQLLQKRYAGQLGDDAEEFIYFAVDGAWRLDTLIDGLLAFSRVNSKGSTLQPVDSVTSLYFALENLKLTIEEQQAEITFRDLPMVVADRSQLVQLLQNLIDNAIKYRRPELPPRIHISAQPDGVRWQFSIQDNGIGFDKKHAERIFQVFQRLHTQEKYPGIGVGLAICKRIIDRHDGRIWAESAPGEGTTIYFTLPALPEDSASAE